jgi:16S rRNA (cytosine967-C5)-methyltransferase
VQQGNKADIKLNKESANIEALVEIQRNMMNNAAKYLKPGGVLVYSTCTINRQENEENVKWFLENHKNFKLDSIEEYIPEEFKLCVNNDMMSLLPHKVDTDGFFAVRFKLV